MTLTTEISGVVDKATAKVAAIEAKGASYVPQILKAHQGVADAEKNGYRQSLDAAIACGKLLNDAKEAIKRQFKWEEWRQENFGDRLPQTTASLYMRLAKNEKLLKSPDPTTPDGQKISNGLLKLGADGQLSIKKAGKLLVTKRPRGKTQDPKTPKTNEDIGREWLKTLAPDELLNWLQTDHDVEFRKALWMGLGKVFGRG